MNTATTADQRQGVAITGRTFTVTTRRDGVVTFVSTLTDEQVLTALQGIRGEFAASLRGRWGRLSEAQLAWAHKLAVDTLQPEPAASDVVSTFETLFRLFETARKNRGSRLQLRLDGVTVKSSKDGNSLWVLSQTEQEEGHYGPQPKYLGKITRQRVSEFPASVREILEMAAADPLSAAVRYGRETGNCSCCGRELNNPESIRLGIGPICRAKFGL